MLRKRLIAGSWVWLSLLWLPCACGENRALLPAAELPPPSVPEAPEAPPELPEVPEDVLAVSRVVPGHGPFSGEQPVVLRGAGFTRDAEVWFGERQVEPDSLALEDTRRLALLTPPSEPGPVDVRILVDGEQVLLADGYTYDALRLDPQSGSVAGGTRVVVESFDDFFEQGDTVQLDGVPCQSSDVQTPRRAVCVTPAHDPQLVAVSVVRDGGTVLEIADVFTFTNSADGLGGGLAGGPIDGVVNITVLDDNSNLPVPGAFVVLGDPAGPFTGTTDEQRGQITFSAPDLSGPQTVTVSKPCYENGSIVAFDSTDVTVFLRPWDCLACLSQRFPDGIPLSELEACAGPPGGAGRQVSSVEGELLFPGPNEFGPDPWSSVPEPGEGQLRVAYVYTSQRSPTRLNPSTETGLSNPIARVLETNQGDEGYPYRIVSRTGGLAVWAIAGLEDTSGQRFTPYVMGVARGVVVGPGENVRDVHIDMSLLLEQQLSVQLTDVPGASEAGPDQWIVSAHIDLGAEGVIARRIKGDPLDERRATSAAGRFDFGALPPLEAGLSGARLGVRASWVTGPFEALPTSFARVDGIAQLGEVQVGDFIGIPSPGAPVDGGVVPADRILRWSRSGAPADFQLVTLVSADGNPAWRLVVRGDEFQAPLPDFSLIDGLGDIASGAFIWSVQAARVPGFSFENFSYSDLRLSRWSRGAAREMVAVQ